LKRGTLPVVMLVVIVAWALLAVLLLTGTLVTAQKINNRVGFVNAEVKPIDKDLDSVVLAVETGRIAGEINTAAKPLTAQFTQIVQIGDGIEASAVSIAERAKEINGSVKSINSIAGEINPTVGEINSGVDSIGSRIASINAGVQSVNTSVDGISGSFDGILGEARSIDGEVAGINLRADTVIGLSQAIKANTEDILEQAVLINENAEAITESPLIIGGNGNGILDLNQRAAVIPLLPSPGPASPGAPGTDQQPLPDVVPEAPAPTLPLPDAVPGAPVPTLPMPDAPKLLPETGLLESSGSDSGNLLGALG
ncbi:MAG: hypothetical protein LC708_01355, partial [Actinobacteria bacterium]|nr:hypothetical protein [Actinomycetota bacterium]